MSRVGAGVTIVQIRKLDFSHGNPSTRANLFDSFLVWNKEVKKKNAQRNVINKYFVALYVKNTDNNT